ncbi:MAG: A/G-specific adenine glycosylase, partial [Oscillibacter sp.]|nr:A/G-specific adenine glycosylase [Oscillibacter sp.]
MKESDFAAPLLDWYRRAARDLPWRHTRDPYCIWVSEVMLQQTRVAAVVGYYARFLDAFPTVDALAAASEDALLSRWQGLGYYSRARNLHRAAREIARRGGFPETAAELRTLPGIGAYTAGAIASAAFGERVPAVDGNVLRVMSRLTDNHGDILTPSVRREIEAEVSARFPASTDAARIFNQALMELGATVCVPNGPPKCGECPVAGQCLGRARGTAETLPVRAAKKARRVEERTVLVLCRGGKTALRKRP